MATIELKAEPRTVFGKHVKTLRREGLVPAEIYGRKSDNQSIQVPEKVLAKVLADAGNTNLISIKIGKDKAVPTLARNIQYSPVKRHLLHVDFYAVVMTDTVTVSVPITIIGSTDLIDKENGTLMTGLNALDIEALPGDIPESIEVDISILKEFSDAIHVADLVLPEGATIHSNLDSLVASIQPPRLEEEEEEVEELEGEISAEVPTIDDEETEE